MVVGIGKTCEASGSCERDPRHLRFQVGIAETGGGIGGFGVNRKAPPISYPLVAHSLRRRSLFSSQLHAHTPHSVLL